MAEGSFARDVQQLRVGAGAQFRGEGIPAITKALLENRVGYFADYQWGADLPPMDVLAEAADILAELGVHFESSANEAAAAAALATSAGSPRDPGCCCALIGTNGRPGPSARRWPHSPGPAPAW